MRYLALSLILTLTLALAACGGGASYPYEETATAGQLTQEGWLENWPLPYMLGDRVITEDSLITICVISAEAASFGKCA